MGKQLVVCLDGTGNRFSDCPTNVVRMIRSLPSDDRVVVSYYDQGVGTFGLKETVFEWQKVFSRVMGLAFGWGTRRIVEGAYRFLATQYQDGDQIFIIGFSRGAYAARCLAALIRSAGLVRGHETHLFDYAWSMLLSRDKKTRKPDFKLLAKFKATFGRPVTIRFLGLYDTVKSTGWVYDPVVVPYSANNTSVQTVRHAVSIDERRCFFRQNQWRATSAQADVREVWFAGVHSDIGGGYAPREAQLALLSHRWMLGEAVAAGLLVDPARARKQMEPVTGVRADWAGKMHESLTGAWKLAEWTPQLTWDPAVERRRWYIGAMPPFGSPRPRRMPADALIHASVRSRRDRVPDYQPVNLPKDCALVQDAPLAWEATSPAGSAARDTALTAA
jgi:uncharacterized protein (DUF2235 family)